MKILVIQQKKIGDVLTASILFEALRREYPSVELHYLVNSHTQPVLENNPYIDEIVDFTTEMQKNNHKFYGFLKSLKQKEYDIVIDAYGKISSNLISLFSKADKKIAFHKWYSSFIYTDTVKRITEPQHNCRLAIEHRFQLLKPLGIPFQEIYPKLYLTGDEIDSAKAKILNSPISLDKPLVMVGVLGSMPQKTYPKAYMVELLDYCILLWPDIQFLFNYTPDQREEAHTIYNQTQIRTQGHIFFKVFGNSLREFMAITYHCDAMIGNEGGANNMAKALGLPTFTLFSPGINKKSWFGENDKPHHAALHPSEFLESTDKGVNPKDFKTIYESMTPRKVKPYLENFLYQFLNSSESN